MRPTISVYNMTDIFQTKFSHMYIYIDIYSVYVADSQI